jgi:hypothetical protein
MPLPLGPRRQGRGASGGTGAAVRSTPRVASPAPRRIPSGARFRVCCAPRQKGPRPGGRGIIRRERRPGGWPWPRSATLKWLGRAERVAQASVPETGDWGCCVGALPLPSGPRRQGRGASGGTGAAVRSTPRVASPAPRTIPWERGSECAAPTTDGTAPGGRGITRRERRPGGGVSPVRNLEMVRKVRASRAGFGPGVRGLGVLRWLRCPSDVAPGPRRQGRGASGGTGAAARSIPRVASPAQRRIPSGARFRVCCAPRQTGPRPGGGG